MYDAANPKRQNRLWCFALRRQEHTLAPKPLSQVSSILFGDTIETIVPNIE